MIKSIIMRKAKNGFTIVEIMIIVAIIALLAVIAIPNLLRARIEANDSAAKAALKTISNALEVYATDQETYPPEITSLTTVIPPYLTVDYFTGTHHGFTFTTNALTSWTYAATAAPISTVVGSGSFTISTGGILTEN